MGASDERPGFTPEQRGKLATLYSGLVDCAAVLHAASERVDQPELRVRFRTQAHAWQAGAQTLGDLLSDRPAGASERAAIAALQRAWVNVKSSVGDTSAIVARCRQQVEDAHARLDEACRADFPDHVRAALHSIRERAR